MKTPFFPNIFINKQSLLTLCSSFLYFDISFAIWVILGAVGTFIADELKLTPLEKGIMVALPILSGSGLRIALGIAESGFGGKKTALIAMGVSVIPLVWGFVFAHTLKEIYLIGILLGVAGASFAVAIPMASRWFLPQHQGLVLGLAGSGNSGTLLSTLFGPMIAHRYGWHSVFGFFFLLLFIVFLFVLFFAEDAPRLQNERMTGESIIRVLCQKKTWLLSLLYSLSFGGFIGFSSYLGFFLVDEYGVEKVEAGGLQTLLIASGSLLRPLGGAIADKLGGIKVLFLLFSLGSFFAFLPSFYFPLLLELTPIFFMMGCLGLANGAIFQLVGTQTASHIGLTTGVVGAAGGIGGFLLPIFLGKIKESFGSCSFGFRLFSLCVLICGIISIILLSEGKRPFPSYPFLESLYKSKKFSFFPLLSFESKEKGEIEKRKK
ncbi:MFS transporter [Methylacidiphilum kamchatkense]|nr:MFS transporter [Methylacidiphilum kamchatkense]